MSRYLSIKEDLVSEIRTLVDIPKSVHADLIVIAIESLEGVETEDKLLQFAAAHQLDAAMVVALADSLATLIWELAKASSTVAAVSGLLNSIFPPEISTVISKCYSQHKKRISAVKSSALAICGQRYRNMSWRIDVELGRRSMASTIKPAYMMRIDVMPSNSDTTTTQAIHMEASYASLKNLQKELERAVDELNGVHSQRIAKYIV